MVRTTALVLRSLSPFSLPQLRPAIVSANLGRCTDNRSTRALARRSFRSVAPLAAAQTASRGLVPVVIQSEGRGERAFDIFSRLLRERIIFVSGEINDDDANIVVAQLLFLEAEAPEAPINLYINSPGGSVTAGLAIYDAMTFVSSPVHTLCLGQASSMGSILLAAGTAGQRRSLPNASIMIHQPSGGAAGQASDIAIRANEILRVRARLVDIYQRHCGSAGESVEDGRRRFDQALERDYYLTAEAAKSFGLIDEVIVSRKSPPAQHLRHRSQPSLVTSTAEPADC